MVGSTIFFNFFWGWMANGGDGLDELEGLKKLMKV